MVKGQFNHLMQLDRIDKIDILILHFEILLVGKRRAFYNLRSRKIILPSDVGETNVTACSFLVPLKPDNKVCVLNEVCKLFEHKVVKDFLFFPRIFGTFQKHFPTFL